MLTLEIILPIPTAQHISANSRVVDSFSAPINLPIDITSPRFFVRDDPTNDDPITALLGSSTVDDIRIPETLNEKDDQLDYLLDLTPKDWKQQDHYRVLGLQHLRYQASIDDIKAAHRRAVLNYHPDKLASKSDLKGYNIEDAYKCIAKSFEILSDPIKRLQFDSVDPGVSDDIPTNDKLKSWWNSSPDHTDFFTNVNDIFIRESRFSKKSNIPKFGHINSTKREVDTFYNFWYNLDSTRTFEYLDSEDAELADNRYNKRHAEQKNKAERVRRKNEDNTRLRTLVDRVLKVDERMKRFKEEEKLAKKNKSKPGSVTSLANDKQAADIKAAEQEELAKKKAQEEAIANEKAQLDAEAKLTAKAAKEVVKKAKKAIKNLITKEYNYLSENPTAARMEQVLIDLEVLLEAIKDDADRLTKVLEELQSAGASSGRNAVGEVFNSLVNGVCGK